jgi:aspartokinase-like uncharacterized kinase
MTDPRRLARSDSSPMDASTPESDRARHPRLGPQNRGSIGRRTLTVVKVGGGLGRGAGDDALRALCRRLGELGERHRLLVVPGGGWFADAVREADRRLGLRAATSHRMAILAMEQFGRLLGDLIPGAALRNDLMLTGAGRTEVLLPAGLALDELPASWKVTSDSIAAWVARKVGAGRLVLVKAADVVDEYFATAIAGARFEIAFMTPEKLPDDPLLPSPHG